MEQPHGRQPARAAASAVLGAAPARWCWRWVITAPFCAPAIMAAFISALAIRHTHARHADTRDFCNQDGTWHSPTGFDATILRSTDNRRALGYACKTTSAPITRYSVSPLKAQHGSALAVGVHSARAYASVDGRSIGSAPIFCPPMTISHMNDAAFPSRRGRMAGGGRASRSGDGQRAMPALHWKKI